LALLTPAERRRGGIVLFMMLLLALLETAGVASIMPFLAVVGDPESIGSTPVLSWMYELGGFASHNSFLRALGLGAFVLIVTAAAFQIGTTYVMNRFIQMRRATIGARL